MTVKTFDEAVDAVDLSKTLAADFGAAVDYSGNPKFVAAMEAVAKDFERRTRRNLRGPDRDQMLNALHAMFQFGVLVGMKMECSDSWPPVLDSAAAAAGV